MSPYDDESQDIADAAAEFLWAVHESHTFLPVES